MAIRLLTCRCGIGREMPPATIPVLSRLDVLDFDELWLFAVDAGNGLSSRTTVRASLGFGNAAVEYLRRAIIRILARPSATSAESAPRISSIRRTWTPINLDTHVTIKTRRQSPGRITIRVEMATISESLRSNPFTS